MSVFPRIPFLSKQHVPTKNKQLIEWVTIPEGAFMMGSPENETGRNPDETLRKVTVKSFRMSKYPVTFKQFDHFCRVSGHRFPDDNDWGRGNLPVINVTLKSARAFAAWPGGRLPSEAEWEYACRAGTSTTFLTGETLGTSQANYNGLFPYAGSEQGEFRQRTTPVGSFAPNAWGLCDMHGNVWEWCHQKQEASQDDQSLSHFFRDYQILQVFRGGGWSDPASSCRSASRSSLSPGYSHHDIGFRIVRDI